MDPHVVDAIECEIRSAGYRRIAIQSSDVESATTLSTELSKRFSSDTDKRELYVLGDVFIGSCCTDLIASRRCAAEYVLHIGSSCQSSLAPSIPVWRVFSKALIDPSLLTTHVNRVLSERDYTRVVLIYDPSLHHHVDLFTHALRANPAECYLALCRERVGSDTDSPDDETLFCGRTLLAITKSNDNAATPFRSLCSGDPATLFLYIRVDSPSNNTTDYIAISCSGSQFHVLTVTNEAVHHLSADVLGDKIRQKRYRNVDKVLSASTIGILVISRNLRCSSDLRSSLSKLIESKGKRAYTLSVNCLTEAKLANFPTIDVYCLLSCGEAILSLPDEISRRTVAPFELLVAFDCIDWSCPYDFEFSRLLRYTSLSEEEVEPGRGGEIRKLQGNCELKSQVESFMSSLSDNSKRTFGGVDPAYGISDKPQIIQGFHGTASAYEHERRL